MLKSGTSGAGTSRQHGKASYSVACGVLLLPWRRRDGGRETPSTPRHHTRRHRRDTLTRQHAGPRPRSRRRLRHVCTTRKEGRHVEAPDAPRSAARAGLAGLRGRSPVRRVPQGQNLFGGNGGKPTKTGQAVLKLQTALPRARVVYCTQWAPGQHLGYMDRSASGVEVTRPSATSTTSGGPSKVWRGHDGARGHAPEEARRARVARFII